MQNPFLGVSAARLHCLTWTLKLGCATFLSEQTIGHLCHHQSQQRVPLICLINIWEQPRYDARMLFIQYNILQKFESILSLKHHMPHALFVLEQLRLGVGHYQYEHAPSYCIIPYYFWMAPKARWMEPKQCVNVSESVTKCINLDNNRREQGYGPLKQSIL